MTWKVTGRTGYKLLIGLYLNAKLALDLLQSSAFQRGLNCSRSAGLVEKAAVVRIRGSLASGEHAQPVVAREQHGAIYFAPILARQ